MKPLPNESDAQYVERLLEALEEREADMHMRIRQGYDKTVADCWRAELAKQHRRTHQLLDDIGVTIAGIEREAEEEGNLRGEEAARECLRAVARLRDKWVEESNALMASVLPPDEVTRGATHKSPSKPMSAPSEGQDTPEGKKT